MKKQIQKTIIKILEDELITVLAVCIVALGVFWVRAGTSISTSISLTIYPPEGLITVTQPDGGETWNIGTSYNITWDSAGPVNNVKIELQRTDGGSWEEIVDSTEDDGSHPWIATSPATTSAKVRITKVGDATVTDQSDATFTIRSVSSGGGGASSGTYAPAPGVYTVTPRALTNISPVELVVDGFNLDYGTKAFLGSTELSVSYAVGHELLAVVPAGFAAGTYTLSVKHPAGKEADYGAPITVYADTYEAYIVEQSDPTLTMLPGSRAEVWVRLQNSSNYTWLRDGVNQTKLGVAGDGDSIFYDPSTWLVPNRAARLFEDDKVEYGEVAEFRFLIRAPTTLGEYEDHFAPVVEGVKWLSTPDIRWHVRVVDSLDEDVVPPTTGGEQYYSATWVRQSPYLTLNRGDEATMWVEFRNTGTLPWTNYGQNPVRLGTSRPRDRQSDFWHSTWVIANRPAVVPTTINPGEIGRFTFTIKAPLRAGRYREYFQPVAEFITWMEDWGVYWDITVRGVSRPGGVVETPSTGGTLAPEEVAEPVNAYQQEEFSDGFERFWQSVIDAFSGIASGFGGLFGL